MKGQVMTTNDDHADLVVDTGDGRWFVLDRAGATTFRLVAGPYQTEAAVDRWMDHYTAPAGVDLVVRVRCGGAWPDAIAHAEDALGHWKQRLEQRGGKS